MVARILSYGPVRVRLYARVTWRSRMSAGGLALKHGAQKDGWRCDRDRFASDSVKATGGPPAPRLSLKDVAVGAAEAGPAPALHQRYGAASTRHAARSTHHVARIHDMVEPTIWPEPRHDHEGIRAYPPGRTRSRLRSMPALPRCAVRAGGVRCSAGPTVRSFSAKPGWWRAGGRSDRVRSEPIVVSTLITVLSAVFEGGPTSGHPAAPGCAGLPPDPAGPCHGARAERSEPALSDPEAPKQQRAQPPSCTREAATVVAVAMPTTSTGATTCPALTRA